MKKEMIVFGIILLFVGLAIMPSISAIQQKTIEDIEVLNDIKHPILYEFVYLIYTHREIRLNRILNIAVEYGFMDFEVRFPVLFLWGLWLGITSAVWFSLWKGISDNLGWGWFEDF